MFFFKHKAFDSNEKIIVAHHQNLPKNCSFFWDRYQLRVEVSEGTQLGESKFTLFLDQFICRASDQGNAFWWVKNKSTSLGRFQDFEALAKLHASFSTALNVVNEIPRCIDMSSGQLPVKNESRSKGHRQYPRTLEIDVLLQEQDNEPTLAFGLSAYRWYYSTKDGWQPTPLEAIGFPIVETFTDVYQLQEVYSEVWHHLERGRLEEIKRRQQTAIENRQNRERINKRNQELFEEKRAQTRLEKKMAKQLEKALDGFSLPTPMILRDPLQEEIETMKINAALLNKNAAADNA